MIPSDEFPVAAGRHDDAVVAEVRRVREELAARFNYDLAAIVEHARERTKAAAHAGRRVVSLPPRQPSQGAGKMKRAG